MNFDLKIEDGNLLVYSSYGLEEFSYKFIDYYKNNIDRIKQMLEINEDLKIIVDELEKYSTYSEILNILGKPDTKVNRDYIGNIKRGKTYKREVKMILDGKKFSKR